jgi:hypothetical protein
MPAPGDFHTGASQTEILESFGAPSRKQSFLKSGNAIWGAIEDFWPQVPQGSTVESWGYQVEGGTIELYFIDQSDHVDGLGFAPAGVVFETGE